MTALSMFPGVIAQEVSPNPKCNNCLHYEGNAGKIGVCTIGLRPWLCGEGDNQIAGYSPLDGQKPTEPGDAAGIGQADGGADRLQMVPMSLTVLGDEHATLVKSIHDDLSRLQKAMCPLHQNATTMKSYSQSVGAQICSCQRIASKSIAQKLFKSLENKERVHLTEDDVLFFVRGVRKGMEPFDIAREQLHRGVQTENMSKSLSEDSARSLRTLGNNNALAKSLYGEDWTIQFIGTDLFDDAAKLREQEIAACEDDLKRRIERRKKEREAAAARKVEPEIYDWDAQHTADEKLRIAKARLMLKLQKHRNKRVSSQVSKSVDNDLEKGWKQSKPGLHEMHTPHGSYKWQAGKTYPHEGTYSYTPKGHSFSAKFSAPRHDIRQAKAHAKSHDKRMTRLTAKAK